MYILVTDRPVVLALITLNIPLLVEEAVVKIKFVVDAVVAKRFVEVALENTDEEARNVPGRVSVLTDER